ncbi:MAG: AAA family ATPase [archaeon]
MEWYQKLGFKDNPFSVDPRANHNKLVSMDDAVDEIFYRIDAGSLLVIETLPGCGKTTLLMMAAKKFGGKKNVVYVDCIAVAKTLNITRVLQDKYGMLGRLINKKPKNMIVLLDNVQYLSKKNTERLKYYFDQNYIKSIIFTSGSYRQAKFSDSLRDRIGSRVIKIKKLSPDEAVEIVRKRIGDLDLFNDSLIKKIFKMSDFSVQKLLQNCERSARSAAQKNRKRVQLADLKVLMSDEK